MCFYERKKFTKADPSTRIYGISLKQLLFENISFFF